VLGDTSGTAVPAGAIGEKVLFDYLTPALGAIHVVTNIYSKSLSTGTWQVFASVAASIGTTGVAVADNYLGVSISSVSAVTDVVSESFVNLAANASNGTRLAHTNKAFPLAAPTTIYITARHGILTAGDATFLNIHNAPYAIRIA
jgi:hypothetical protein